MGAQDQAPGSGITSEIAGVIADGITDAAIDPREVEKAVWSTADGAMVTFSG